MGLYKRCIGLTVITIIACSSMLEPEAFSSYLGGRLFLLILKSMVMLSQTVFLLDYSLLMDILLVICKT